MSKILVLSAHGTQLDRRIVAETNVLAASGRDLILVSVPTRLSAEGLDPRVRVVVEKSDSFESPSVARRLAKRLPAGLYDAAQSVWYRFGEGPSPHNTAYFLRNAPGDCYDAIHCHDLKTLPAGAAIRERCCPEAKLVYDSHEYFPFQSANRSFQRYWTRIERRAIAEADLIITVNESIAREMADLYSVARPRVLYNSYGAGSSGTALSENEFLSYFRAPPGDGAKVLFQGNLSLNRNLKNLVAAFPRLRGRARLFLLGDGSERAALERLCRRKRIGNVHFGPWAPQDRLLDFVRAADVGVIPYQGGRLLNNRYCTPNKLFEYIEAGVPICASDLPELRRIICECGIGGVYPMNSPGEIARALSDCLSRRERKEFAAESFASARDRFSWRTQAAKLLEWYEELGV
jgi:glycosyltransferase involved in cell wall biosynthesis